MDEDKAVAPNVRKRGLIVNIFAYFKQKDIDTLDPKFYNQIEVLV